MKNIYKCLFIFLILLVSVGVACASDDIALDNETSILSVNDNSSFVLDDTLSVESDSDDLLEGADAESSIGDSSNEDYKIITGNITKYDFKDEYKIQVVNESGNAVYWGHVDFYVNNNHVATTNVSFLGYASFNLNSYIKTSGTYDISTIYTNSRDYGSAVLHQQITVDDVPMDERDIQILFENIKLYDLGEKYSIKVVDKKGNPVRKGHVIFIAYDQIILSNISESGIASFYLPSNLNITGHLYVWSMYSDGPFNDLIASEQITIGTRTLVALDKNTIGSRMMHSWNNYKFNYTNGSYVAPINDNVNLVLGVNGNCYLMYENTINNSAQLTTQFRSLAASTQYDVVKLNLLADTTYTLSEHIWEDQEWYYASRVAYGQLIVNGNGAVIKCDGEEDLLNFMYIGREANVNFNNVEIRKFNHVFINQGNLLCQHCSFIENYAYKLDVYVTGLGTVIHNYNTAVFDFCEFTDNDAEVMSLGYKDHEKASILYAEPYSLNIFNCPYGTMYEDSFYCCNFTTTIIYGVDTNMIKNILEKSVFDENSYFATVDRELYNVNNKTLVFEVEDKADLISVFKMLNTFITANNVVINLAPGTYEFSTGNYGSVRDYNYRHMKQEDSGGYNPVEDRYLLDVGYCPVTINGNDATIKLSGNDDSDDYHFAYIGKFGFLALNDVRIEGFNTALFVTGRVVANYTNFLNNVIDHTTVAGDYGGAFRSHGGTVICHNCDFIGNVGDNVGDYSTDDFYADMGSYVELKNCNKPKGYMAGSSYLKGDTYSKQNVDGATYNEKAFESNFETVDFAFFNVGDTASYNKLRNYLGNHTVSSLYINFTGNYDFELHPVFDRKMAIVFNSNGHNVKLSRMYIESPSTMTFMGFNFNNINIEIKGSATFINCNFYNNKNGDDYFFSNKGSTTLVNCSIHDNECDDYIILNTGSLTIFDGSFRNNVFDDDYGIIYNNGGTVNCINATFSGNSAGYYIFNFASGNAAFSGSGITSSNVEFDNPWANWKAGLVQGAFLLGTALITYGAGAAIGAVIPGVAGLVVASVAGAGIGAVSGLTYGLIEGNVYHDYSNVWKHALSFAFIGLGMAQAGFATQSNFIRQVDEAFNPAAEGEGAVPGQGAAPGQGAPAPQNPQGPGGDLHSLMKNPQFQADLQAAMEGDLNALESLGGHQQLSTQIHNALNSLSNGINVNVNVNMQELLALYSTMQTVLARQEIVPPEEAPINLINRVVNNQNNLPEVEMEIPLPENPLPFDEGSRLLSEIASQNTYIHRVIQDNPNLDYIRNRLNLNTYRYADSNHEHADRVLTMLSNFNVLYNRARNLGWHQMSNDMMSFMRFFNDNIGHDGNYRSINNLFNVNLPNRVSIFERIYERALLEYNRIVNSSNIGDFNLDGQVNLSTQLESRINNLLQQLENRFEKDPENLDKYNTLRDLFTTTNHNDLNVMLKIYRELSEMTKIPKINIQEYLDAISYDYPALIKNNIYYSVFNRIDNFNKLNHVNSMLDDLDANLKLLRQINITMYNEIMRTYFEGKTFSAWKDNILRIEHEVSAETAIKTLSETYKQVYDYFNTNHRSQNAINEDGINTFYVKNLFKGYLNVYNGLSNSNKLFLNKYFHDRCSELIKSFNGVYFLHGIEDQTENFNKLSNVSDLSRGYFEKLTQLYTILIASKGNDNLFNKNITGLNSAQIGDMIIEDLIAYYNINYVCLELTSTFLGQQDPNFYILGRIMNWVNHNSIDDLKSFYNSMASFRAELHAVYIIEQQLYLQQPIDTDFYRNNLHSFIALRNWLSNELFFEVSKMYNFTYMGDYLTELRNHITEWFIDNQDYSTFQDGEMEKLHRRAILFIKSFNYYLEHGNIENTPLNLIELMLGDASGEYPVRLSFGGEYSSLINLELGMDLNTAKELQRDVNPKSKTFSRVDVAELTEKLELLKTASPVAYWILMDQFGDKYDVPMISETKWTFNKKLSQFCTKDIDGNSVTYYDFAMSIVNAINQILPAIGAIEGDQIIYKSMNYNIARLMDYDNKYNNIFNKRAFYNNMIMNPDNVEMMIKDMEYDLNYLKNIDSEAYEILNDELFKGEDFYAWAKKLAIDDLLMIYNGIFDSLEPYRNNTKVMENEVNVIINQMNNNIVKALKNNPLSNQIRPNLLYFIYLWEFLHKNTNEGTLIEGADAGSMMSWELINAPIQDIFNRYLEILNYTIFCKVFDYRADLNELSLEEMRDVFNDNLYRAYHSPIRYAQVFKVLQDYDNELLLFNNFRDYENYFNSINDKNVLIELYNTLYNIINHKGDANVPSKPNTKPNPIPDPVAEPVVTPEIVNEAKKIILDENIYDDDPLNIYNSKDEGYFQGSWKAFVKKYPELSDIVVKDLMKGNFDKYLSDNKYDYYNIRQKIVEFLENYKPANNQANNQPVNEKDSRISKSQFEDIRKIMEDCNINPEGSYNVIGNEMMHLFGSWEKVVKNYPDVAKKVAELLFYSNDILGYDGLDTYAGQYDSDNDYKVVRQNIIDFIRNTLLKEDAANIEIVDDPVKIEILINNKPASECSIDEINAYTLTRIRSTDISDNLVSTLLGQADSIYTGYVQYVDAMKSAGVSENEYAKGINQFKYRYVEILKQLNSKDENAFGKYTSVVNILMDTSYEPDVIMTGSDFEYQKFLVVWAKLENEYPDVAKYILQTQFQNNMGKLKEFYMGHNDIEDARAKLVAHAQMYLYVYVNQNPNIKSNDMFIEKENVIGASREMVKGYMQNAVDKADAYVENIRKDNYNLANSLKLKINDLYADYLKKIVAYSHEIQYILFIDELNKLFENVKNPKPSANENPQTDKFHIQKENLNIISPSKAIELLQNTMDNVQSNVDKINKTNPKLAQWLSNRASQIAIKYEDSILLTGDKNSYDAFVNEINKLIKSTVGFASSDKIENEVVKTMDNDEIKNLIRIKIHLNPGYSFSEHILSQIDQPNLSKQDLIALYDTLNSYMQKDLVLKDKNQVLTKGNIFLALKTKYYLNKNKAQKSLENNLRSFKTFFPDLHQAISLLFKDHLSRLSELSNEEMGGLYNDIKAYTIGYFMLFRNTQDFQEEIKSRNIMEDMFYEAELNWLNEITFNFFDSTPIYFIRNLDTGDAETIKNVIQDEMNYMSKQDNGLYSYCLNKYFNGASSPEAFFESLKDTLSSEKADKYFQDLYKNIHNEFNSVRNLLEAIDKLKTDTDKKNAYIESFEKAHNVDLSSDAAKFTRTLVIALMNLNSHNKYNLTNMLLQGLNKDGSLNEDVKKELLDKICDEFYLADFDVTLKEEDFEMLVDIMTSNFPQSFKIQVMADYLKLSADVGGAFMIGTKDSARYQLILSLVLKNKLLFDSENVILYHDELNLLNALSTLKCYKLMSDIIQLKLKGEFSNKNTVKEGLIPGLDDIRNSIEYKILYKMEINPGDKHINSYYTVFNKPCPKNLDDLVELIDDEVETLGQFDVNLQLYIMSNYFADSTLAEIRAEFELSHERVTEIYAEIVNILNFWRNKDILEAAAKL